jgi:hypothetical protein
LALASALVPLALALLAAPPLLAQGARGSAPPGAAQPPAAAAPAGPEGLEPLPEAPPPPSRVISGEVLEPEVTIVQRQDERVEEYRQNGRLYLVRIVPAVGRPYYYMDNDGDGVLETRSQLYSNFNVPMWVLFSW